MLCGDDGRMSQGNPKGKGGTVMLSNSPFAQPGAPPPGAPQAPPPGAPPQDAGGWGAPPGMPQGAPPGMDAPGGGYGAPPGGGFGAPPPGAGYGAPPGGNYGAPPGMAPPGMAPPPAMAAAPGGGVPDHVQGQKTKLLGLEQNIGAALGYFIGLLSLLFIIMEPKENRFVRFHAFQWLFMAIAYTFNMVLVAIPIIIANVDSKLTEAIYAAPVLALPLIPLGICALIAVFKAFQGKAWKIPVIGGIAEKLAMK